MLNRCIFQLYCCQYNWNDCSDAMILTGYFCIDNIGNVRSISALDTAAVQRAKARQQYATMARMKVTPGTASLRK